MDCGKCGLTLSPTRSDGLFEDEQEILCESCGAKNQISVDDNEDDAQVYVSYWRCVHGIDGDTECAACEAIELDMDELIEERS